MLLTVAMLLIFFDYILGLTFSNSGTVFGVRDIKAEYTASGVTIKYLEKNLSPALSKFNTLF